MVRHISLLCILGVSKLVNTVCTSGFNQVNLKGDSLEIVSEAG